MTKKCRTSRRKGDEGVALATGVLMIFIIGLMVVWISTEAVARANQSAFQDDNLQAFGVAEGALDRYRSKLIDDPYYYRHYVDASERSRICSDSSSGSYNVKFDPGSVDPAATQTAWPGDCASWTYVDPPGPWIQLGDTEYRVEVQGVPGGGVQVTAVGREDARPLRAIIAEYERRTIAEFMLLSSQNIVTNTPNSNYTGKFYSLGNCDVSGNGTVLFQDYWCEGDMTFGGSQTPPGQVTFQNGAWCFEKNGVGGSNCGDIRDVLDEPIDFNGFWNDLEALKFAACNGGGLCVDSGSVLQLKAGGTVTVPTMNDPDAAVRFVFKGAPSGVSPRIELWVNSDWPIRSSPSSGNSYPTQFSLGTWQDPASPASTAAWVSLGEVDYPTNGAIYSAFNVLIGWCDKGSLKGNCQRTDRNSVEVPFGLYAGSPTPSGARHIIFMDSFQRPAGGSATASLMASGATRIHRAAYDGYNDYKLQAAVVTQGAHLGDSDRMNFMSACYSSSNGDGPSWTIEGMHSGSADIRVLGTLGCLDSNTELNQWYDPMLEEFPPPWTPVIKGAGWELSSWSEVTPPDWAR